MANDLFGSTEAPKWLNPDDRRALYQKIASEQAVGSDAFSSAFRAAWESRSAMGQAKLAEAKANATASKVAADEAQKEHASWEKDQPTLVPWLMAGPEKRKTMDDPIPTSKTGIDAALKARQADETYDFKKKQQELLDQYRKGQLNIQDYKAKHGTQVLKQQVEYDDVWAQMPPSDRDQIEASLGTDFRDDQGFYSPEARAAISAYAKSKNIPIGDVEKRTAATVKAAEIGATSREKVAGMKEEGAEKRQTERLEEQEKLQKERLKVEESRSRLGVQSRFWDTRYKSLAATAKRIQDQVDLIPASATSKSMMERREKLQKQLDDTLGKMESVTGQIDKLQEKSDALDSGISLEVPHDEAGAATVPPSQAAPAAAPAQPVAVAKAEHSDAVAVYDPKSGRFQPTTKEPEYIQQYRDELYNAGKGGKGAGVSKGARDLLAGALRQASIQDLGKLAKALQMDVQDDSWEGGEFRMPEKGKDRYKKIDRAQAEKLIFDEVLKKGLPKLGQ